MPIGTDSTWIGPHHPVLISTLAKPALCRLVRETRYISVRSASLSGIRRHALLELESNSRGIADALALLAYGK
jgi:hypothetical protein